MMRRKFESPTQLSSVVGFLFGCFYKAGYLAVIMSNSQLRNKQVAKKNKVLLCSLEMMRNNIVT